MPGAFRLNTSTGPVARNCTAVFAAATEARRKNNGEKKAGKRERGLAVERNWDPHDLSADWQTLTYILHADDDIFIGISIHYR